MARMVHRHVMTGEEAGAARRRRPVGLAESMWPIGWLFGAAATAWLTVNLRGLLEPGALAPPQWGDDALLILRTLGDAAIVALPAGLILGMPGARRRNPWLLRGLVLLALVQLARPAINYLDSWLLDAFADPLSGPLFGGINPAQTAMNLLGLANAILSIAGIWSVSGGLFDAGARPQRGVVVAFVVAGALFGALPLVPATLADPSVLLSGGWLGALGITISLVSIALWFVALARLLAGWVMGLEPRPAWALGAAAVALLLADRLAIDLWLALGISGDAPVLTTALAIASYVPWMALLLAFAMGLGRGTARRVAERRVVPQYELGTAGG